MKSKVFRNLKILILFLILFFFFSFNFLFLSTLYADEAYKVGDLPGDLQDILIKRIDIDNYPRVEIYLSFKEGSELESFELEKDDFSVFENGEKIENLSVEQVDRVSEPIGVVLVLDTSGSMKGEPISDLIDASLLFISQMRSMDKFSIVGFADEVTVYSDFTSDREKLLNAIAGMKARGETSLFDGIIVALERFEKKEDIKYRYLIVLSDGKDTVSKSTVEDAIDKALETGAIIYSIALLSYDFNPDDIRRLSEMTGGEMLVTANSKELKKLYSTISRKIKSQYRITYTSIWPNTENVKVKVNVEKAGLLSSTTVNYKNPFYVAEPSGIITSSSKSFFLSLFDKWWVRVGIYGIIFIGIVLFFYAVSLLLSPRRWTLKERTQFYEYRREIGKSRAGTENEPSGEGKRKGFFGKIVRFVSGIASKRGFVELFDLNLERAGMSIRASEFITLHIILVIVSGVVAYYLGRNIIITFLIVLLAVFVPFLLLSIKASQRLRKFHEQLPDALQLISGSLKAGYSFNQALNMIVDETRPPISDEFRKTLSLIRMGLPEREALESMAERINSEYFNWTVMAINVQREVGGNLAEVMDTIASTIRERDRVMSQIKALTAEGRLSAIILIILPIAVFLMLLILNRDYISLMFTTRPGLVMLAVAGVMMIIGIIWIIKIVQIKY